MKIALCGLIYSLNLGDTFISKSLQYIIKNVAKDYWKTQNIEFIEVDFYGRTSYEDNKKEENVLKSSQAKFFDKAAFLILTLLSRVTRIINKSISDRIKYLKWSISPIGGKKLEKFYSKCFANVDVIIIDGGGIIECSFNHYENYLYLISQLAEKMNIPVIYNAVGCVGAFDNNDYSCSIMRRALLSPAVKKITVRDNLEIMKQYLEDRIEVEQVADSAVWISEALSVKKNESSQKIGVGLIRGTAFTGYGINFSEEDMIQLQIGIITELKNRGYEWELFSNGYVVDQSMGEKIIDKMNESKRRLANRPTSAYELLTTISNYKGIITYRLHSCVAAYSLDIPFIGISWNNKVDEFMKFIGYPERVITMENMKAETIVDKFENALNQGYDHEKKNCIRKTIVDCVKEYKAYFENTENKMP